MHFEQFLICLKKCPTYRHQALKESGVQLQTMKVNANRFFTKYFLKIPFSVTSIWHSAIFKIKIYLNVNIYENDNGTSSTNFSLCFGIKNTFLSEGKKDVRLTQLYRTAGQANKFSRPILWHQSFFKGIFSDILTSLSFVGMERKITVETNECFYSNGIINKAKRENLWLVTKIFV